MINVAYDCVWLFRLRSHETMSFRHLILHVYVPLFTVHQCFIHQSQENVLLLCIQVPVDNPLAHLIRGTNIHHELIEVKNKQANNYAMRLTFLIVIENTWSRSVGMKVMALQVAATLMRLQKTVYLTGVFSSMPWNRLLSLKHENTQHIRFLCFTRLSIFIVDSETKVKSDSFILSLNRINCDSVKYYIKTLLDYTHNSLYMYVDLMPLLIFWGKNMRLPDNWLSFQASGTLFRNNWGKGNWWKGLTTAFWGRVSLLRGTWRVSHIDSQWGLLASLSPGSTVETRCCSSHSPHLQKYRE